MDKLPFNEWKDSMSFMIDDDFDANFLGNIDELTYFINSSCINFSSYENLKKFLIYDKDPFPPEIKLKSFISLIGFSEERLKRVGSLIRSSFLKEKFASEWTVNQISGKIRTDKIFRNLLLNFFLEGRNSEIGEKMPQYYMRNFKIQDPEFIEVLKDYYYVSRILNDNEIQGKYSNRVGAHVEELIQENLDQYKNGKNPELTYQPQKEFPLLNKNIDFLIPNVDSPIILIESSYNITTGSGQSKRADQLVEMYTTLIKHNANQKDKKIMMINYCDGLGWVGRQRDLRRIYDASDFVFNQANLEILENVLDEFY